MSDGAFCVAIGFLFMCLGAGMTFGTRGIGVVIIIFGISAVLAGNYSTDNEREKKDDRQK